MINIITCILALAVALLAALCFWQSYVIGRKDDRLTKLYDERQKLEAEVSHLKKVIDDRDYLQIESDELIQNLNNKLRAAYGTDSSKGPTTEAVAEDRQQ